MSTQPRESDALRPATHHCVECVMAWLLFGNGAKCLAGHGLVYYLNDKEST